MEGYTVALFWVFENGHYAAGLVYFDESNSKKLASFVAEISLSKITVTLKIYFFKFENV